MTTTLTLLRALYRAAPRNGDSYARAQQLLAQGSAAYAIDGDWAWSTYRTLSDTFQIGIAPLPSFAGQPTVSLIGGSLLMRHRNGQATPDEIAAILNYLYQPDIQVQLSTALERLPARRSALVDPRITDDRRRSILAAQAITAPGLPPTPAARCAIFGVESYLYNATTSATLPANVTALMQREALACLRRITQP